MDVTRVVVGASFPRKGSGYIGADQLAACVDFDRQVYGWLYLNAAADWRHPLTMALQAYATIPKSAFWIDVEEEPVGLDVEGVRHRIRDAIAFTNSADIYTRVELWNRITGDWNIVLEYPNARLWKADPPPDDGLCGGFDHATMIQTDFDTDIGTGFVVDVSEYEEEHMPTPEYEELKQADKNIETVIAAQATFAKNEATATDFLIAAVNAMAVQVYGDNDPRTLDLQQRVTALEASRK